MTGLPASDLRTSSFGQDHKLSLVDRFGTWLSTRRMRQLVDAAPGQRFADIGCGYHARFGRTLAGHAESVLLVDVSLSPELKRDARVTALEGGLPEVLDGVADESVDGVPGVQRRSRQVDK